MTNRCRPTTSLNAKVRAVHRLLIEAYGLPAAPGLGRHGRARSIGRRRAAWEPIDPLDELINTILSQNTNDLNRDRAYHALRAKFPTWEAVRDAPTAQVIAAIKPAGLANQKGPRIQKVLERITAERGELDIRFLGDLAGAEAQSVADVAGRRGPEDRLDCAAVCAGQAGFSGRYAHSSGDGAAGVDSAQDHSR